MKHLLKISIIKTLPVMAGYIVLGIGFGILSQKNGYGFWCALAMSVFVYAGSMQYVAISLISAGASLLAAALTTLMVNARHLFYGISMVDAYKDAGKRKPYLIFGLTDETYSLVCTGDYPEGVDKYSYCLCVSLLNQLYWVTGTVLGVAAGNLITIDTKGIDFSMTALFFTVFVEQWKGTKNHIPAVTGVVISILCLLIFGREHFLIPAMVGISLVLTVGKKQMEKTKDEGGVAEHE